MKRIAFVGGGVVVVAVIVLLVFVWRGPSEREEAAPPSGHAELQPPDTGPTPEIPSGGGVTVEQGEEGPPEQVEEAKWRVPEGVISGHVVDEMGAPISEAEVAILLCTYLQAPGENGADARRIRKDIFEKLLKTDAGGWFEVTGVPTTETVSLSSAAETEDASTCILVVQKAGYGEKWLDVRQGGYRLRIVLEETIALVSGRVVARQSGEPLQGARIVCRSAEAVSDADGQFEIKVPVQVEPPDVVNVSVSCYPKEPSYAPEEKPDVAVVQGGVVEGLLFELDEATAIVRGTVVDQQEQLAPGLLVRLYEYEPARVLYFPSTARPEMVTDAADGRFQFVGVRPGTYQVEAVKGDWHCVLGRSQVTVEAATEPQEVKVVVDLAASRIIAGRVTNSAGEPVRQAAIWLVSGQRMVVHQPAASDAEGRYGLQLPQRSPGRALRVMTFHPDYELTIVPVVSRGEQVVRLDLVLKKAGQLAGTVTSAQGEPVEGVAISVQGAALGPVLPVQYSYLPNPRAGVTTDADGTFTFSHLAPGQYVVTADHDRYVVADKNVQIATGVDQRCDFVLDEGVTIAGKVVDTEGKPVSVRSVVAVDARGREHAATESAVDGSFVLRTLPQGEPVDVLVLTDLVNLRRDKSFYYARVKGVAPGRQDVQIVATRMELGRVELQVVDKTSGEPVGEYEVRCAAQPRPGLNGLARSFLGTPAYGIASARGETGVVALRGLLPGSHRFTVRAQGYRRQATGVVQVPSGGTVKVRVELVPEPVTTQ